MIVCHLSGEFQTNEPKFKNKWLDGQTQIQIFLKKIVTSQQRKCMTLSIESKFQFFATEPKFQFLATEPKPQFLPTKSESNETQIKKKQFHSNNHI